MAKLHRFHQEGDCYHITTSTQGRVPVFLNAEHARLLVAALQFIRSRAYLLAYAVMPDHLHSILVPRSGHSISNVMQSVKGYTARSINATAGRRGRLWQQSFYDRLMWSEQQLFDTIEYVHMNPVVAGLAERPEDYEFSSAGRPRSVDLEELFR